MARLIKLSPHSLSLFLDCPRCFWLRYNQRVKRPEAISPSVPRGLDYVLKGYFDYHRKQGMVPELSGLIEGQLLEDEDLVSQMRKTSFGIELGQNIWFRGALDDAVRLEDGSIVPLDNKTKGFPPKGVHWSYEVQLASYVFILKKKGIKTKNFGYLAYWFLDHKNLDPSRPFLFQVKVERVEVDPTKIARLIDEAVKTLKGPLPKKGCRLDQKGKKQDCPFCDYREWIFAP